MSIFYKLKILTSNIIYHMNNIIVKNVNSFAFIFLIDEHPTNIGRYVNVNTN